ncbi:DUF4174 domain-containing protein [uncultured Jannaschia sp.]|uniref:DUF4174 domain-containing protein n=1 Tax=uncultured Jannaschia sp. TaxID=293347 RepID=UPI00262359E9|nr:DUF4174 domain-containing protein [uncultured Jannaschia sp.]
MTLKTFLPILAAALTFGAGGHAADTLDPLAAWEEDPTLVFDATEIDLAEFLYAARPVVVFANSPRDPAFIEQMGELEDGLSEMVDRDVVVVVDTDPAARSELRTRLRPRGFMLVLIGKDGQVKLRKPLPWTTRELSRSIDKMPMRQRELREGS